MYQQNQVSSANMMRDPLFFVALLPGEEIQHEVTAFKRYCAVHFGARHSLTSPPHITMVPPFGWDKTNLPALREALDDFAATTPPFDVTLRNFSCFPPRVIYVDVVPNPLMATIAENLAQHLDQKLGLKTTSEHGFNPHMTIAHRDLQRELFPKAWSYFSRQEYQRSFTAEGLTLLRHEQRRWELDAFFSFS